MARIEYDENIIGGDRPLLERLVDAVNLRKPNKGDEKVADTAALLSLIGGSKDWLDAFHKIKGDYPMREGSPSFHHMFRVLNENVGPHGEILEGDKVISLPFEGEEIIKEIKDNRQSAFIFAFPQQPELIHSRE